MSAPFFVHAARAGFASVDRRYREAGLSTIGVQSSRFPFGDDEAAVAAGLAAHWVEFPQN